MEVREPVKMDEIPVNMIVDLSSNLISGFIYSIGFD